MVGSAFPSERLLPNEIMRPQESSLIMLPCMESLGSMHSILSFSMGVQWYNGVVVAQASRHRSSPSLIAFKVSGIWPVEDNSLPDWYRLGRHRLLYFRKRVHGGHETVTTNEHRRETDLGLFETCQHLPFTTNQKRLHLG